VLFSDILIIFSFFIKDVWTAVQGQTQLKVAVYALDKQIKLFFKKKVI